MSNSRSASAAPFLKFYSQHRQKLMNISLCALLIAGVSTATSSEPAAKKSKALEKVSDKKDKPKPHLRISRAGWLRLIKSSIPSYTDPAVYYFILHLFALIARAFLSLEVASLDGKLVAALISKKTKKFLRLLVQWMLLGIPAAIVNSALHYSQSSLAKYLRVNLTTSLTDAYLPDNLEPNYYTLMTLDGRISDPDQRISTDVARLSRAAAALPGQILKPTLDLVLCAGQLFNTGVGGAEGTVALGLLTHFSSILLKFASPSFAKLASERARLEGALRSTHSKVVTNAEEIALLRGHERELDTLDKAYYELERFSKTEYKKRAVYDVAHDFIVKYTWGAAGLVLCSAPVFVNKYLGHKQIAETVSAQFITNRRLLVSASDSLGRLILARKFVAEVVGHAFRVAEFQDILTAITNGESAEGKKPIQANGKPVVYDDPIMDPSSKGTIKNSSEEIGFYGVPLITPANVALTRSLTFRVKHGQHLLIAGPNGCGKSSLFRVLGGLWPVRAGTLIIPGIDDMFYLPQRAYLSRGTLREQVVYPSTIAEFREKGHTDSQLLEILKVLDLDNLITENMSLALNKNIQVNPWDLVRDWPDELSVGAQQRLAMARLYYHKPKFAVLDECTSAVSPEMEQFMYTHAQDLGISILSVAHRTALWHFHDLLLKFDGKGGYYFGKLDATERLKYEDERLDLDKKLREVPYLNERLKQLKTAQVSQEVKRTNSSLSLMKLHGASSGNLKKLKGKSH
ncbi:hypothetical protein BABINDRAFT_159428 [Babjeviella inositovora NRRL Y-12698]|uniref:ABC transporter domain-containing protein n=1 Tax=Babjeviella inositovora NRRL Y-12698 TaxID=984486 RepID=A0A1E3QZ85_9ASCO|nr:uncharacterized protein BABINDRAFT_159428 [Babjeviella inositovora NRRL Y-12698]ODQ82948.1 hypothetical protein BABINDRAFT_159428 [Babjeviella inositovora NRRL Y-12698]